jgi:hypothetical protein
MRKLAVVGSVMLAGCCAGWGQATDLAGGRCAALAQLKLDGAVVVSSAVVPAGAPMDGVDLKSTALPSICRVRVTDKPSADSETLTEVWLPMAGWNGRLNGIGNGGFAGNIYYDQMAAMVMLGLAASGTDAGHEGMTGDFALGHPEKVKDFGWRAVHDTAVISKALVQAFYGKTPSKSYFMGCSDGGREALMEAQRFPEDYDGILAGAPANNWTALVSSGAQDERVLHASAASEIPVSKLPAIGAAVRAACDAQDGVKDGVLNDPQACDFKPESMLCKGVDTKDCLTSPQVTSLKEIYSAKVDRAGKRVFPGYLPGAEDAQGSWNGWLLGEPAATMFFATGYFGNFVYDDPAWKLSSFEFGRDYAAANAKTAAALNATDPDLKAFTTRGGKLVMYHGWNDPAIPALSSVEYYDRVRGVLGGPATDAAVRLYMVPGMLHCDGGPGATQVQRGLGTALVMWVETGAAPGTIVASGNGMTRPICVWPAVAKYEGGDTKVAASFSCVK